MRTLIGTMGCALALTACSEANAPANVTTVADTGNATVVVPGEPAMQLNVATPAAAPAVNLASDGLSLVAASGSARMIGFGMERGAALPALTAALGTPSGEGNNPECGAGPLDHVEWRGGMTAYFQEGRFVGWDLDGREGGKFATAAGIGIGSTRAQLEVVGPVEMQDSTIGNEFTAGGMSGLLSDTTPSGKVTNLWAGVNCIFR